MNSTSYELCHFQGVKYLQCMCYVFIYATVASRQKQVSSENSFVSGIETLLRGIQIQIFVY
jgi:hypothetical protein